MPLSAGSRLGPYQIIAPLGAGGMGEVYRARDTKLERDVALKILPEAFANDPDRMARFEREAKVLAALNHPHIAAIYGLEQSALVMELVEGPTLAERIARGPLPLEEALPIARQIAEALEYAHEKGIIHRDLKPANVKLTADEQVKLLDFGLAKALEGDAASSANPANSPTLTLTATHVGTILGTAGYMSPEQAKGKQVDRRADIWAFGVVLYEMLVGRQLYAGETIAEILAAVLMKDPALESLPANTPGAIRRLLGRCLDKEPKRRLRDIGEARVTIDEVVSGPPEAEPVAGTPPVAPRRLRWLPWAVTAAAIASAAALALIHFRETPPPPRAIRFTIQPPEKQAFAVSSTIAISPDGSRLAFVATSETRNMLWIRTLSSLTGQAVPGSEGASDPFWSPDGRFIGFFANRKLMKVDTAGGPPQTICEAPNFRGGAWGSDGSILVGGSRTVLRIPASGGTLAPVTTTAPGDIAHDYPSFLPDGRHFIYQRRIQGEGIGVYLGNVDSRPPENTGRLVATLSSAVYAPVPGKRSGYLVFQREGALMAQRFDPRRFQTTGDPFQIVEFGSVDPRGIRLFSASDTGIIAYRNSFNDRRTRFTWFDRSGKELASVADVDILSHPSFSPDGKRLVWNRSDPRSTNHELWISDLTRDATSRFTFDPSSNDFPVWSPAGDYIYFGSSRGGTWGLYRKLASGAGAEEVLYQSANWKSPSSLWPGRFLLYGELDANSKWDIWALPDSGERKPVPLLHSPFNEMHGQFSPDGKWMAYTSDETGRNEIYVQPYPLTGAKVQVSIAGGAQARWRNDGREIFYLSADLKLMSVDLQPGAMLQVGRPKALFQTRGPTFSNIGFTYAVSNDGQRFLVNTRANEMDTSPPIHVLVNWIEGLK